MTDSGHAALVRWLPRPELFRVRGVAVRSYPAMLYVGCVLGVYAGVAVADDDLESTKVAIAIILLLIPAMVGSRLLFVIQHRDSYRANPRRIWDHADGGAALYGGLILSLVISIPLLRLFSLPFWAFWDAAAVTMLVGTIFTRFGCLTTGCCGGRETRHWIGVDLPDHAGVWRRRVPTQLLEAAWAALVLVVALAVRPQLDNAGALFGLVVALYGAGRVLLERQRESDEQRTAGRLNIAVSAALFATGFVIVLAGSVG